MYHLSEVKGMALWKQKFEPLGLDAAAIEGEFQDMHNDLKQGFFSVVTCVYFILFYFRRYHSSWILFPESK